MAESHLPDDLEQWPREPFAVLGVARPAGRKTVRAAYAQLIRRFKPERFPDHFRRIREAYDRALEVVQWNEWEDRQTATGGVDAHSSSSTEATEQPIEPLEPESAPASSAADAAQTPPPEPNPAPPDSPPRPARPRRARSESLTETLDRIWRQALAGDAAAAYSRLKECEASLPGDARICLRAYWILSLYPWLDGQRNPCEWLVRGLERGVWNLGLAELYRRELERRPDESFSPRCLRLLEAIQDDNHLLRFLDWRWAALHRTRRWDLFEMDVARLRSRFEYNATAAWVRLLLHVAERFAWEEHPAAREAFEYCRNEAGNHRRLELEMANEFDRFDQLDLLVHEWRHVLVMNALLNVPDEQRALMPLAWRHSAEEIRRHWDVFAAALARDPDTALSMFDHQWRSSPRVVRFLLHRAKQLSHLAPVEDADRKEILELLIGRFLAEHSTYPYQQMRRSLLAFCLSHAVTLPQVFNFALESPYNRRKDNQLLSNLLSNDAPLEFVCVICRTFWA